MGDTEVPTYTDHFREEINLPKMPNIYFKPIMLKDGYVLTYIHKIPSLFPEPRTILKLMVRTSLFVAIKLSHLFGTVGSIFIIQ